MSATAQRAVVANVATNGRTRTPPGSVSSERAARVPPLADGRSSIVWSLPQDECARVLALDDEAFRAELGAAFDFRLGEIASSTARAAFPLRMRLAKRYVAGRSVLAGDAAHVVHPLADRA